MNILIEYSWYIFKICLSSFFCSNMPSHSVKLPRCSGMTHHSPLSEPSDDGCFQFSFFVIFPVVKTAISDLLFHNSEKAAHKKEVNESESERIRVVPIMIWRPPPTTLPEKSKTTLILPTLYPWTFLTSKNRWFSRQWRYPSNRSAFLLIDFQVLIMSIPVHRTIPFR